MNANEVEEKTNTHTHTKTQKNAGKLPSKIPNTASINELWAHPHTALTSQPQPHVRLNTLRIVPKVFNGRFSVLFGWRGGKAATRRKWVTSNHLTRAFLTWYAPHKFLGYRPSTPLNRLSINRQPFWGSRLASRSSSFLGYSKTERDRKWVIKWAR